MKYKQHQADPHRHAAKVGVLITNLGTPAAPKAAALRPYLKQFLSDPRVVEIPRLLWWLILNLVILVIRPPRAAKAYAKVWTDSGSPLATHTQAQACALKTQLQHRYGDDVVIEWAMRYGEPSINSRLQSLFDQGVQKLLVLPLYPQYSATTTGSTFDAIAEDFTKRRWLPELRFINSYHSEPAYIDALIASIVRHTEQHGMPEKLIFSYHGIPLRYLHNGDPYHCFCLQTTRLVAQKMGLSAEQYTTCFQSRFGREPWLQPYTDKSLASMAKQGVKSVAVICPGFSADCLETIEEIDMENREVFLSAGGRQFHYIPALNSDDAHIDALAQICYKNIDQWCNVSKKPDMDAVFSRYTEYGHNTSGDKTTNNPNKAS